jgi:hypothetical protein
LDLAFELMQDYDAALIDDRDEVPNKGARQLVS